MEEECEERECDSLSSSPAEAPDRLLGDADELSLTCDEESAELEIDGEPSSLDTEDEREEDTTELLLLPSPSPESRRCASCMGRTSEGMSLD